MPRCASLFARRLAYSHSVTSTVSIPRWRSEVGDATAGLARRSRRRLDAVRDAQCLFLVVVDAHTHAFRWLGFQLGVGIHDEIPFGGIAADFLKDGDLRRRRDKHSAGSLMLLHLRRSGKNRCDE